MNILLKILGILVLSALGTVGVQYAETKAPASVPQMLAGSFNPTGGGTYRLQTSVGTTDTSVKLSSFKEPISGISYTMSYLNSSIGYGTLDPQNTTRKEFISFTGITQNSDGTALLTGVTRGLGFSYPFTASSTLRQPHPGQSIFILSDSPQLFSEYYVLRNVATSSNILYFSSTTPPRLDQPGAQAGGTYIATTSEFATVAYVNTIALASAPNADETTKGVVELATGLEAASSTLSGSTAARLAIPASIATDTPNVGTRGSKVLMSLVGGFLNQSWLDLSANWTFTAASSTGFGVLGSALAVNSVNYRFPAAQGTASTTLVNNGSGVLSWGQPFDQLLDASTTPSSIAGSSVATTTLYSFNVPANTLSTGNLIRVKMYIQTLGVTNAKFVGIEAAYGNASTTMYITNGTAGLLSPSGVLEFLIQANGTNASQVTEMNLLGSAGFGSSVGGESSATLSVDSTQAQKIVVAAAMSNNNASDKFLIRRVTTEVIRY